MEIVIVSGEKRSRNKDFAAKLKEYSDDEWDLINVFPNPVGILTAILKPKKNVKPDAPVVEKKPKKTKEQLDNG